MATPQATHPAALPECVVVLKGGGVKGLAFAGALRELEREYRIKAVYGTSAGAIAAVLLAAGYTGAELAQLLEKTDFTKFVDPRWKWPFNLVLKGALNEGTHLQGWLESRLQEKLKADVTGGEQQVKLEDLPTHCVLFVSHLKEGLIRLDSRESRCDTAAAFAARCSSAIPFFFTDPEIDGAPTFDGGVLSNFPYEQAVHDYPSDRVLGLYLVSTPPSHPLSIPRSLTAKLSHIVTVALQREDPRVLRQFTSDILRINTWPVSTTSFSLSSSYKQLLLLMGRVAALPWLERATGRPFGATDAQAEAEQARESLVEDLRRRRRRRRLLSAGAAALLLTMGLWLVRRGDSVVQQPESQAVSPPPRSVPPPDRRDPEPWPQASPPPDAALEEALGELLIVGVGRELLRVPGDTRAAEELFRKHRIRGLLLRHHNLADTVIQGASYDSEPARRTIGVALKAFEMAVARHGAADFLVAADQEGGDGNGVHHPVVTDAPAPMALGALRSRSETRRISEQIGRELSEMGVTLNLAPVLDVNLNESNDLIRDRSFGGHYQLVGPLGVAAIEGSQRAGIGACAKHFPGHGHTAEGLHEARPPLSRYSPDDFVAALEPFRLAVRSGVDAIMTSHFAIPRVRGGRVVTTDPWYVDLLKSTNAADVREAGPLVPGLGFAGPVMSDDILVASMSRSKLDPSEALTPPEHRTFLRNVIDTAIQALEAKHDILVLGGVRSALSSTTGWNGYREELTADEFDLFVAALKHHFMATPERRARLRDAVSRARSLRRRLRLRTMAHLRTPSPARDWESMQTVYRASFCWTGTADGSIPTLLSEDPNTRAQVLLVYGDEPAGRTREINDVVQSNLRERLRAVDGSLDFLRLPGPPFHAEPIVREAQRLRATKVVVMLDSKAEVRLLAELLRGGRMRASDVIPVVSAHPNIVRIILERDLFQRALDTGVLFAFSGQELWAQQVAEVLINGRRPIVARASSGGSESLASELPVVIPGFRGMPSWEVRD